MKRRVKLQALIERHDHPTTLFSSASAGGSSSVGSGDVLAGALTLRPPRPCFL